MLSFALWAAGVYCIGFGMLMDWRKDAEPMATVFELVQIAAEKWFGFALWVKYPPREVLCPNCGQWHPVSYSKDDKGNTSDMIMGYRCEGTLCLCGVAGRAIDGLKIREAK